MTDSNNNSQDQQAHILSYLFGNNAHFLVKALLLAFFVGGATVSAMVFVADRYIEVLRVEISNLKADILENRTEIGEAERSVLERINRLDETLVHPQGDLQSRLDSVAEELAKLPDAVAKMANSQDHALGVKLSSLLEETRSLKASVENVTSASRSSSIGNGQKMVSQTEPSQNGIEEQNLTQLFQRVQSLEDMLQAYAGQGPGGFEVSGIDVDVCEELRNKSRISVTADFGSSGEVAEIVRVLQGDGFLDKIWIAEACDSISIYVENYASVMGVTHTIRVAEVQPSEGELTPAGNRIHDLGYLIGVKVIQPVPTSKLAQLSTARASGNFSGVLGEVKVSP